VARHTHIHLPGLTAGSRPPSPHARFHCAHEFATRRLARDVHSFVLVSRRAVALADRSPGVGGRARRLVARRGHTASTLAAHPAPPLPPTPLIPLRAQATAGVTGRRRHCWPLPPPLPPPAAGKHGARRSTAAESRPPEPPRAPQPPQPLHANRFTLSYPSLQSAFHLSFPVRVCYRSRAPI
jgi:hypothetical protein